MKYFKNGDILLADFDGVFLDSQEKFLQAMGTETDFDMWMEYLTNIDWGVFLRDCTEIEGATETFLELQKLNILKGFITRIHSFDEGKEKASILRENGLFVPIYYVLPMQAKSIVYKPNEKTYILDDDPMNNEDWEKMGGKSLLYDPNCPNSTKKIIKRLPHLLE